MAVGYNCENTNASQTAVNEKEESKKQVSQAVWSIVVYKSPERAPYLLQMV